MFTCRVKSARADAINRETLEVKYKDKSIFDVLDMNVEEAAVFFENIPSISRQLQTLLEVDSGISSLDSPARSFQAVKHSGSSWRRNFPEKAPVKHCIFWMSRRPDYILQMLTSSFPCWTNS